MNPAGRKAKPVSRSYRGVVVLALLAVCLVYAAWYVYQDLSALAAKNKRLRQENQELKLRIDEQIEIAAHYEAKLLSSVQAGLPFELGADGIDDQATCDQLIEALLASSGNRSIRWQAQRFENLLALISTSETRAKWAPKILETIDSGLVGTSGECWAALNLLASLGDEAKPKIPALLKRMDFEYPISVREIGFIVLKIDPGYDLMPHVIKTIAARPHNGQQMVTFIQQSIPRAEAINALKRAIAENPDQEQQNRLRLVLLSL